MSIEKMLRQMAKLGIGMMSEEEIRRKGSESKKHVRDNAPEEAKLQIAKVIATDFLEYPVREMVHKHKFIIGQIMDTTGFPQDRVEQIVNEIVLKIQNEAVEDNKEGCLECAEDCPFAGGREDGDSKNN